MMKYYKRNWDESRGDDYDFWGTSIWYFECGEDDWVLRQIEVYNNGTILKYDESRKEDQYGGLSEAPLERDEFAEFEIAKEEFEKVWASQS